MTAFLLMKNFMPGRSAGEEVPYFHSDVFVFLRESAAYAYAEKQDALAVQKGQASLHGGHAGIHEVGNGALFADEPLMQGLG